ncbi:MAG: phosphatase PAP2 family protein [Nitrospirae bacterium YQR-1]
MENLKNYKNEYGFSNRHDTRRVVVYAFLAMFAVVFAFSTDALIRGAIAGFFQNHKEISFFYDKITPVLNFIFHGTPQFTLAILILIIGRYRYPDYYIAGKTALLSLTFSGLAVQAVKHITGRARPRVTDVFIAIGPTFRAGYDSFPSGHTALAFSIAVLVTRYFPGFRAPAYFFAVLCAFHRVKTGSHFPSDVVAGAFAGVVVTSIIIYYFSDNKEVHDGG